MTRAPAAIALFAAGVLASCASTPVEDGPTGVRPGTPTLTLSGSVPDGFEPTFWTSYVAASDSRRCTRVDGTSGRVLRTVRHRYPVQGTAGRYRVEIPLDARDDERCAFRPEAVHFVLHDRRTGLRTDGYLPVATFGDGAGTRSRAVVLECQGWPVDVPTALGCSLPRVAVAPGVLCSRPEPVDCRESCEVTADFRRVDPPREDALWAVPPGCG